MLVMQDFPLEMPGCFVDVIFMHVSDESILGYNFFSLVTSQVYISVLFRFVSLSYSTKMILSKKLDIL